MCNKKSQHPTFEYRTKSQYRKVIKVYPVCLFYLLDKWLKAMSKKGWHIVHCGLFFFIFERGLPFEKEYFTYQIFTQEEKYNLLLMHPFLEETYGVKKKKSRINANKTKVYQIVEIDTDKIDVAHDVGYNELVSDRNRLYFRYSVRNYIVFSVIILILFFVFRYFL